MFVCNLHQLHDVPIRIVRGKVGVLFWKKALCAAWGCTETVRCGTRIECLQQSKGLDEMSRHTAARGPGQDLSERRQPDRFLNVWTLIQIRLVAQGLVENTGWAFNHAQSL